MTNKNINKPDISEEDYLILREISVKLREIARRYNLKYLDVSSWNTNEKDKDSYIKYRTENSKGVSMLSDSFSKYQFISYKQFMKNMSAYGYRTNTEETKG